MSEALNLGCAGDDGMIVTQDADRDEKLRILRVHGSKPKYYQGWIGGAALLDLQLDPSYSKT
jgi:dTDP-4-amino-4,6-dideoxygalactose transaminase